MSKSKLGLAWPRRRDFERAVRDELPVLYRVARRMGCTEEEAEDVVQTTLLKAFKSYDSFDGNYFRSWLIRILRNERLMLLRTPIVTTSLDDDEEFHEIPVEPFWDEVAWRLQAGRILEELTQLPDIYRMVLQLCDVEDLTYEEAATALDIPVGTVRSRLFRARTMLRQRLEPMMNEEVQEVHP